MTRGLALAVLVLGALLITVRARRIGAAMTAVLHGVDVRSAHDRR